MNYSDPIINTFYILASLTQFLAYCYFFKHFLKPKYKYSSLIVFLGFSFFLTITLLSQDYFQYKSLIFFIYIEAISFLLYEGNFIKKVVSCPIIFIVTSIPDIVAQFILVFILQYPVFTEVPYPILFWFYIIMNTSIYIMFKWVLYYFDHHFLIHVQYFHLFVNLMIIDCIITIVITQSFLFIHRFSTTSQTQNLSHLFIIALICSLIAIFLILKTYQQIKTLKQNIAIELTIQSLYTSYLDQLEDYMYIKNNDESIKYLRHDIMNYLQTIQTYQQKKGDEHEL